MHMRKAKISLSSEGTQRVVQFGCIATWLIKMHNIVRAFCVFRPLIYAHAHLTWQVATALLGSALPLGNCQARILALIGGACTEGQGLVVGSELSEQIRSHKDLVKDAAPHHRKSRKFFESVAAELVLHGHTLDIFTCSLDQVRASGRYANLSCQ